MAGQDWMRFVAEVEEARDAIGCGHGSAPHRECYYRGHSSAAYELRPGLYRQPRLLALPKRQRDNEFWQREYDLFYEFRARARELHDRNLNGWDVLFWMQHYGAPTRLLDWTETFAVAVYFATRNAAPGADACVWLLNPYALNAQAIEAEDLVAPELILSAGARADEIETYEDMLLTTGSVGFELPIGIYPELKNSRIHAQRGSFTLHGDAYGTIDEQLGRALSAREAGKVLRKVTLPYAALSDALEFLRLCGVDQALLFPDLASLAVMLRERYGY